MWNSAIEKSLNRKIRARYLGLLIVVSRNRGGAYILGELDGSVLHRPITVFQFLFLFIFVERLVGGTGNALRSPTGLLLRL
jgi:hypothetical protein